MLPPTSRGETGHRRGHQGSFRDSLSVSKTNIVPAAIVIVLGTVVAIIAALSLNGQSSVYFSVIWPYDLAVAVISYFAVAAVRTLNPSFRLTFGLFWGFVGYALLTAIAAAGALAAPLSVLVLVPVALAVLIWMLHFQALVYGRWTWGLIPRAGVREGDAPVRV